MCDLVLQNSNRILYLFSTNKKYVLAPRGENCCHTGEIRARGAEISSICQVTRNGRTIEAEDGGTDAGEEAQPGTQGNHIMSHIVNFPFFYSSAL